MDTWCMKYHGIPGGSAAIFAVIIVVVVGVNRVVTKVSLERQFLTLLRARLC